jgi:hypothetical protein
VPPSEKVDGFPNLASVANPVSFFRMGLALGAVEADERNFRADLVFNDFPVVIAKQISKKFEHWDRVVGLWPLEVFPPSVQVYRDIQIFSLVCMRARKAVGREPYGEPA